MSLTGPIYFNGTTGPMQNGSPVIIRGADFEYWCCLDECLEGAYQEHRKALGHGEDTSACITSDMLITWLETYYSSFIDHNRAGAPLSDDKTTFVYYNEARWYSAAGIDGTWKQGDLAKAFNALKWTLALKADFQDVIWTSRDSLDNPNFYASWAEAKAGAEAAIAFWTSGAPADLYPHTFQSTHGYYIADNPPESRYYAYLSSLLSESVDIIDPTSGDVAYTGDVYLYPTSQYLEIFNSQSSGLTDSIWNLAGNLGDSILTTTTPPNWCDEPTEENLHKSNGWGASLRNAPTEGWCAVVKWSFTEC